MDTAPPLPPLLQASAWQWFAWTGVLLIAVLMAAAWAAAHLLLTGSMAIFLVASLGLLRLRHLLPGCFIFLLVLAAVLNGAGGVLRWFETIGWYDEVVHAYTGFAGLAAIGWLAARTRADRHRALVPWCAALGLALGIGWEVVEGLVGDLGWRDTLSDLVLDTLGAALGGLAAQRALAARRRLG